MIEAGRKQPFRDDLGDSWQCDNKNSSICSESLPRTRLFGTGWIVVATVCVGPPFPSPFQPPGHFPALSNFKILGSRRLVSQSSRSLQVPTAGISTLLNAVLHLKRHDEVIRLSLQGRSPVWDEEISGSWNLEGLSFWKEG